LPIRRFLDGQAFEPEMISTMSEVLERVCAKLDLTMKDDPATRLVAAKIIEVAQRGIKDPVRMGAMVLEEFRAKPGN
jgi:hypothetical protein